jgi:hypothetical protein
MKALARRFATFDGLSAAEIVFLRFAPLDVVSGLPWILLSLVAPQLLREPAVSYTCAALGALVIGGVVWYDAAHARLPVPWAWALLTGLVPVLGSVLYALVRARYGPRPAPESPAANGTPIEPGSRFALNPFRRDVHLLRTRITPLECRERLQARTASRFSLMSALALDDRPVRGRVSAGGFSVRKAIHYRNSFQTVASGTWVAEPHMAKRTLIHVYVGPSRVAATLWAVWMALVALFAAGFLAALLTPGVSVSGDALLGLLVPVAMLGFGMALPAFCLWLARGEAGFLLVFLRNTLVADEVTNGDAEPDARVGTLAEEAGQASGEEAAG